MPKQRILLCDQKKLSVNTIEQMDKIAQQFEEKSNLVLNNSSVNLRESISNNPQFKALLKKTDFDTLLDKMDLENKFSIVNNPKLDALLEKFYMKINKFSFDNYNDNLFGGLNDFYNRGSNKLFEWNKICEFNKQKYNQPQIILQNEIVVENEIIIPNEEVNFFNFFNIFKSSLSHYIPTTNELQFYLIWLMFIQCLLLFIFNLGRNIIFDLSRFNPNPSEINLVKTFILLCRQIIIMIFLLILKMLDLSLSLTFQCGQTIIRINLLLYYYLNEEICEIFTIAYKDMINIRQIVYNFQVNKLKIPSHVIKIQGNLFYYLFVFILIYHMIVFHVELFNSHQENWGQYTLFKSSKKSINLIIQLSLILFHLYVIFLPFLLSLLEDGIGLPEDMARQTSTNQMTQLLCYQVILINL